MAYDGPQGGVWQLVERLDDKDSGQVFWFAKFPFVSNHINVIACIERMLRPPTLLELGVLRMNIDNMMRQMSDG